MATKRTAALLLVALASSSCGGGASGSSGHASSSRPSSPARIQIVTPTNGQTLSGRTVHVKISLKNAQIVQPTTSAVDPTKGHIHLYLDGRIVSMNYKLSDTLGKVKPGSHTLKAEFVASDHLPFDPPVFATVAFQDKR